MNDLVTGVARGLVAEVVFRSQVTPEYRYDPWAPSAPPSGASAWLLDLVRPTVDLVGPDGRVTASFAPYGPPERDLTPAAALGALATIVGVVALIAYAARKAP